MPVQPDGRMSVIDCVGVSQAAVQTVNRAAATCWLPLVTNVGVTGNSEHVGPPSGVSMEQPGPASAVEGKSRKEFWNWMRRPPAQGRPSKLSSTSRQQYRSAAEQTEFQRDELCASLQCKGSLVRFHNHSSVANSGSKSATTPQHQYWKKYFLKRPAS